MTALRLYLRHNRGRATLAAAAIFAAAWSTAWLLNGWLGP